MVLSSRSFTFAIGRHAPQNLISGLLLLHFGAITTSGLEQTGELVEFRPMLGNNIMGVEKPEGLALLANSDFFILTTSPKSRVYPFYHQAAQYWYVTFDDFTATVYACPPE